MRAPEAHVFLLWSRARTHELKLLSDLRSRFEVLADVEVTWTPGDLFAHSLTRFYGDALPPGSRKQQLCGDGPLRVVVVDVPRPHYRWRLVRRRPELVNADVFDARARYREWIGVDFVVHASIDHVEADRNLAMLFGCTRGQARAGELRHLRSAADMPGTHGWSDLDQLLMVLDAAGGADLVHVEEDAVVVRTGNLWWAKQMTGGPGAAERSASVGGRTVRLVLQERPPPRRRQRFVADVRRRALR